MLHTIQRLLQLMGLTLAGYILTAFQQLFGEFQFLAVLGFKFIKCNNKGIFFPLDGGQSTTMALVADGDIFQQRLLLHFKRGHLRANAGQLFGYGIEAHTHAGSGGVQQVNGLVRQLTTG